ncbi:MAG: TIGR03663 family protein [Candidatus Aenigmarchaeota archaeon]|nr:TIGR03663 family protein [Candidatus Aenigmarchaeota archaeon]
MKKLFVFTFIFIVFLTALLRLYNLDNRPAHFDEGGGHAIGVRTLINEGRYIYDPDFHGPFLYHITALAFILFGMSDITLRVTQAIFGILTVGILWLLKDHLKKDALIAAALLLAISPSLVYYSRFAVHDSYFVFFSIAFIVFLFLYSKERKEKYLYLTSASLAFLFTVKENAYIFLAVVGFCFFVEFVIESIRIKGKFSKKIAKNPYTAWIRHNTKQLAISFVIFIVIFATIYTSFFRYPQNFIIAISEPFNHWLKKSTEQSGFVQPVEFYFRILREYDTAILFFGLLGIITPFFANNSYTRFASIFGFLNLIIYLLMPYKEPNNIVHAVLPLAIASLSFFEQLKKNIKK